MKNIITTIIFCTLGVALLHAQQQPHNTQFMNYKLGYNPGFAGSQESPCVTCIYRQQWLGLDGAPSMAIATFNMPLNNQRVGIDEMIRMIATARIIMPKSVVRLSAGRNEMSIAEQAMCFMAGANSIFAGEKLLTTPNPDFDTDMQMFKLLGLTPRKAFKDIIAKNEKLEAAI